MCLLQRLTTAYAPHRYCAESAAGWPSRAHSYSTNAHGHSSSALFAVAMLCHRRSRLICRTATVSKCVRLLAASSLSLSLSPSLAAGGGGGCSCPGVTPPSHCIIRFGDDDGLRQARARRRFQTGLLIFLLLFFMDARAPQETQAKNRATQVCVVRACSRPVLLSNLDRALNRLTSESLSSLGREKAR